MEAGDFDTALLKYTASLSHPPGQVVAAILSNLSAASLKLGRAQDAVAYAAAALRFGVSSLVDKATIRLGQALMYLRCFRAAGVVLSWSKEKEVQALAADLPQCVQRATNGCSVQELKCATKGQVSSVEFVGPVKMDVLEGKGRGLRATRCIKIGECILINRALASMTVDENKEILKETQGKTSYSSSHSKAAQLLVRDAVEDATVRRRLELLHTGSGQCNLVPMDRLLHHLDMNCIPPFLPTSVHYAGGILSDGIDIRRAEQILDLNCHGSSTCRPCDFDDFTRLFPEISNEAERNCTTSLFPAVAMLNHSSNPNSMLVPASSVTAGMIGINVTTAVVAAVEIGEGEEITISYTSNKETLQQKWGILQ